MTRQTAPAIVGLLLAWGGTALLVAKVLENPPKGAIVADSRYPSSAAVLEVLVPMADRVFRALH